MFDAIATQINDLYNQGQPVHVNGHRVRSYTHTPAGIFRNGTLSVDVAKKNGQPGQILFFKVGTAAPAIQLGN